MSEAIVEATTEVSESTGTAARVTINGDVVCINDLTIDDDRLANFFDGLPEEEWDATARRALQVGAMCLERANTQADVDYLRKEVESLVHSVRKSIEGFGSGLLEQVGSDKGQVLEPVKLAIEDANKRMDGKLKEVQNLLTDEVDPDRQTSVLGRAMSSVNQLLDPKREDSVQATLQRAVEDASGEKGALAKSVKEVVSAALEPLEKEVKLLAREIRDEEAAEAARHELAQKTTIKGIPFEEELVRELASWGRAMGAEVEHCGGDNMPGDILVSFPSLSAPGHKDTIVIEAKDRAVATGRKVINDTLDKCMTHRKAKGAVYVKRDITQFAQEVGEYAEGHCQGGPWVATVQGSVVMAVRHLRVMMRLAAIQDSQLEVDVSGAQGGIDKVRASLKQLRTINTKVGSIRKDVGEIEAVAGQIKAEITNAMMDIESSLRIPTPEDMADAEVDE